MQTSISSSSATTMNALTTIFSPPASCANRYAVYIATPPWDSTNVPSSGWVDPSFTDCIPSQYSTTYPSFSPGICPHPMTVVASESNISGRRTVWTGRCCQSGFTIPDINPDYFCTSAVTSPLTLLVIPNITTADIYTTLPGVRSIQHDQVTVLWEQDDLSLFPRPIAAEYASMMGLSWAPALTFDVATTNPAPTTTDTEPTTASTRPVVQPTLPLVTTAASSVGLVTLNTLTSSSASTTAVSLSPTSHNPDTAVDSMTTIRPPSLSSVWPSGSTTVGGGSSETTTARSSSQYSYSQNTASGWPSPTPINVSSSECSQPMFGLFGNLGLAWCALFIAVHIA
ncbi:hypothetical protein MN608_07576 [Microdochium nivale]|nr:hypothetical protein MN608_07576 [Microdochium nivale]